MVKYRALPDLGVKAVPSSELSPSAIFPIYLKVWIFSSGYGIIAEAYSLRYIF